MIVMGVMMRRVPGTSIAQPPPALFPAHPPNQSLHPDESQHPARRFLTSRPPTRLRAPLSLTTITPSCMLVMACVIVVARIHGRASPPPARAARGVLPPLSVDSGGRHLRGGAGSLTHRRRDVRGGESLGEATRGVPRFPWELLEGPCSRLAGPSAQLVTRRGLGRTPPPPCGGRQSTRLRARPCQWRRVRRRARLDTQRDNMQWFPNGGPSRHAHGPRGDFPWQLAGRLRIAPRPPPASAPARPPPPPLRQRSAR